MSTIEYTLKIFLYKNKNFFNLKYTVHIEQNKILYKNNYTSERNTKKKNAIYVYDVI